MTVFSRMKFFLIGIFVLFLSSNVFAGTLSDISISSTSYEPGATATYTVSFTTENVVPAGSFSAIQIATNSVGGNDFNFTNANVSLTVDGVSRGIRQVVGLDWILHTYITGSLDAGSEIIMTISNVINPAGIGSYTFNDFRTRTTGSDPIDTGSPSPIVIALPDTTAPALSETTPIATYTSDTTPSYTFTSDEAGTIFYDGACSSDTTEAVVGANTIVFDELEEGRYDDCIITVGDGAGNMSELLVVSTFTVDTTAPVIEEIEQIPEKTLANFAIYRYRLIADDINDPVATPPVGPVGGLEIHIDETDTPGVFEAYLTGLQPGGPYSFTFNHRDQAGNHSAALTVGPFMVLQEFKGSGGSIITPTSADTPTSEDTNTPTETTPTPTPETPKVEEVLAVVPEKVKYVFLVDITPRRKNSEKDVRALQTFFNQYEGEKLSVNGVYDAETIAAVNRFQRKYASEILAPWGIDYATGNVGIYTRKKIAAIMGV